ncbi:ORF108 [Ranid herpesvirus 2]|uniref:ORF108 n=1 Tax=Ranid herpesvirus 2 TaxID=389214 RepID=Q14VZ8_9VIRU|nr:ORF108 [Ranid herpesvirus 2]ABG25705.1 ORF108 [Ranid herpesvirus 2]
MASDSRSAISTLEEDLSTQVKCAKVSDEDLYGSYLREIRNYFKSNLQSSAFRELYDVEDACPDRLLDSFACAARDTYRRVLENIAALEAEFSNGAVEHHSYEDMVTFLKGEEGERDFSKNTTGTLVVLKNGEKIVVGPVKGRNNMSVTAKEVIYYAKLLSLKARSGE